MGIIDRVQQIENRFFHRLETDKPLQAKLALTTWVGFILVMSANLFLGAALGNWLYFLVAGGFAVAAVLGIRNWWRLRDGSDA